MTYLFLSQSEENFRRVSRHQKGCRDRLCIYLDSTGEPTPVTEVSDSPQASVKLPDILRIDEVKDAVCLVAAGALQTKGEEFCRSKGIPEIVDAVLGYMQDLDRTADVIRYPFRLNGALKLKR